MENNKQDKRLNRDLIEKQVILMEKMQKYARINLVDCGHCGSTFLHKMRDKELLCPYCEFKSDPCDFPDFIYDGMINNLCD